MTQPGAGPAPPRHWWSIRPMPPVPPISAGRGYAEILLVFTAMFGANIILAGESLAGHLARPTGSWGLYMPDAVEALSLAGLAAALVILLSVRRGVTPRMLGFCLPRRADGRVAAGQITRMAAWAVVALAVGSAITSALATGRYPEPSVPSASYLVYSAAGSVNAGIVEEAVALAFVVSTLRQAGRRLPEIVAVAVLLRCSYHIYYGPGVAGIAVWAVVFIWLYLRFGSLVPLIAVHVAWDVTIFSAQRWHAIRGIFGLALLALPIAATITWLVERVRQPPGPAPGPALAGRRPPAGVAEDQPPG